MPGSCALALLAVSVALFMRDRPEDLELDCAPSFTGLRRTLGACDGDADDPASGDGRCQKARPPHLVDEVVDSVQALCVSAGHDDGLLDAVYVIWKKAESGRGETPSPPLDSVISTSLACFSVRAR